MARIAPHFGLLLCLAACAAPPPPRAGCSIERVADIAAHVANEALLVAATINHQAVQMQVDTSGWASTIMPMAVGTLHLSPVKWHKFSMHTISGVIASYGVEAASFAVGNQEWSGVTFVAMPLTREFTEDPPVVGFLGMNHLSEFDIELDLPRRRMTLWQVHDCDGDFALHDQPHYRLPLLRYPPATPVVMVDLDGHTLTAAITTGMKRTLLTREAAAQIGVTQAALQADPTGHINGPERNEITFHLHRFAELRIGGDVLRQPQIQVAPILARPGAQLALGLDYLQTRHLWLSLATNQLFIAVPPD